jgi:predicted dienelactone hydrolase
LIGLNSGGCLVDDSGAADSTHVAGRQDQGSPAKTEREAPTIGGDAELPRTDTAPPPTETEDKNAPPAPPPAAQDPLDPPYGDIAWFETVIATNDDVADVYYPLLTIDDAEGVSFPVALLLQGAKVDKLYYYEYARRVAGHGFIVIVANHESSIPLMPRFSSEQQQVNDVIEYVRASNDDPSSPVAGIVDTDRMVLLGHSLGGVCGLSVIMGKCHPPCCIGFNYDRPDEVVAGVFWGTNLRVPALGSYLPSGGIPRTVDTQGIPVAFVQGELDSMAQREDTRLTYDRVSEPPKAYIEIEGANHYGICDVNNPPGADADETPPELDQGVTQETAAQWTGLFLRAHVHGDQDALDFVYHRDSMTTPHVTVDRVL